MQSEMMNQLNTQVKRYLGQHVLVDYFGCEGIHQPYHEIEKRLRKAIIECGGTVVMSTFHEFSPHGVSGVVVIAESHVAMHTWPENGIVCIDIFSCSPSLNLNLLVECMSEIFQAHHYLKKLHQRGDLLRHASIELDKPSNILT
jgi:S-adenosylmethionine decarboxylase